MSVIPGFSSRQWAMYIARKSLLVRASKEVLEDPLPKKVFKATNKGIPEADCYAAALGDDYWSTWTKRTYEELTPAKGWICPNKLWDLARDLEYRDYNGRLSRAMERLTRGADIGCEGDG